MGGKWVDLPSLGSALKTPFEIKVYEIDDMEQLQKRKEDTAGSEVRSHEIKHVRKSLELAPSPTRHSHSICSNFILLQ